MVCTTLERACMVNTVLGTILGTVDKIELAKIFSL